MRKVVLLLMAVAMVFTSCDTKKHKIKQAKISSYRVPNTATADPNDWLYYYLIFNGHSNNYYYYTSPTPVTNFAGTSWTTSSTIPTELADQKPFEEFEEPLTELPNEIEVDMENTIDVDTDGSGAGSTQEEDGDGDPSDGEAGGSPDSSPDAGGDGGGGDGGGGGE